MTLKLLLPPDQDSYSVEDNESVVSIKVDGGPPRIRRDFIGASVQVEVQWTCDPTEYQYLRAFFNHINKGADPFLLDLIIDAPTLRTYVCRFKPGSFKVTKVRGNSFVVKASLDVTPNDSGLDYAQIVANYVPPPWSPPPPPTDWGTE